MDAREYYKEIGKRKGFPTFEQVNFEFEIDDIKGGNIARRIADRIVDKTCRFRKVTEGFLNPDIGSIAELTELRAMTETDKARIRLLYRELLLIERSLQICELENKEESMIDFIKTTLIKWNDIRPKLLEILIKASNTWKDGVTLKEELEELGYVR